MQFDLVLRDGTIFDGGGGEGVQGSVAISDGRIAAVGDLGSATARSEIDCRGRAIAPGFIDMHSHSDWILPNADHGAILAPLVEQGITSLVERIY